MPTGGDVIVLRYHEIALKGRNRPYFVRRLVEHVERVTSDLPVGPVGRASARLLLPLHDRAAWPEARHRLGRVFGLANFALSQGHVLPLGDARVAAGAVDHLGAAIVAQLEG